MKKGIKWVIWFFIGIVFAGGVIFFGIIGWGMKINSESAQITAIGAVGQAIVRYSAQENLAFPSDGDPEATSRPADQFKRWHGLINFEDIMGYSISSIPQKYKDANLWTVIKNIPDNPPSNLVVLATRNIDPSSLRTKLTAEDMQKHLRFKRDKDFPVLNRYAIVFVAGDEWGMGKFIPVRRNRPLRRTTYEYVYGKDFFDLTTNNPADGLQVKYLTSDGKEIIPVND